MPPFRFKQFTIEQDRTAMKVGTDAVLLGAWTPTEHQPNYILDIGTGTGIIALMFAQRTTARQIVGIEIDRAAFEQASSNFENSPWNERLSCIHKSLTECTEKPATGYDLIVSNPPFYVEDYKAPNKQRNLARFQGAMPFPDLAKSADLLLSEKGVFTVIIPFKEEENFIAFAQAVTLFPYKITRVKGNPTSEFKRSLLAFKRQKISPIAYDELIIESARHSYTPEYTELTKAFYLKM